MKSERKGVLAETLIAAHRMKLMTSRERTARSPLFYDFPFPLRSLRHCLANSATATTQMMSRKAIITRTNVNSLEAEFINHPY